MTYILTCGCESQYGGFPSEWDSESRECEPAIAYGCLCDKHFGEYEARPAQYAPRELSDEEILVLYEEFIETQYVSESNVLGFGRAILKKAREK
jgi:hypothetical protein